MNSSDHVHDSEQRLLQVVNSIPGLVAVMTPEGEVAFVNNQTLPQAVAGVLLFRPLFLGISPSQNAIRSGIPLNQ